MATAQASSAAVPIRDTIDATPNADASQVNELDPDSDDDDDSGSDLVDNEVLHDILSVDSDSWQYPEESTGRRCSKAECDMLHKQLREMGIHAFIESTLLNGKYTAEKLCSAFLRVEVPFENDHQALYSLLGLALRRAFISRDRLREHASIDDAAKLLTKSKNILVITGAGISTSLGIPDFRSKNTGFYSKLRERGFDDPEAVFNIMEFDEEPSHFYHLAGDLLPVQGKWSPTHQFIRLLQDKERLLRNYTQNIDNIESYAGIADNKVMHCHGSWKTASCRQCKYQVPGETLFENIHKKQVAYCTVCQTEIASLVKRKRPSQDSGKPRKRGDFGGFKDDREDEDEDDDILQPGVMKPDITFFGEELPSKFFDTLNDHDREAVDLIVVIGTSMTVAPVSDIPQHVRHSVPQIYISRDPINHLNFDMNLLGDCDVVVQELCRRAGWDLQHPMLTTEPIAIEQHPTMPWLSTVRRISPATTTQDKAVVSETTNVGRPP